jgi:hypothetical protein
MTAQARLQAKSRNDRRAVVKQFLKWVRPCRSHLRSRKTWLTRGNEGAEFPNMNPTQKAILPEPRRVEDQIPVNLISLSLFPTPAKSILSFAK